MLVLARPGLGSGDCGEMGFFNVRTSQDQVRWNGRLFRSGSKGIWLGGGLDMRRSGEHATVSSAVLSGQKEVPESPHKGPTVRAIAGGLQQVQAPPHRYPAGPG